MKRAIVYITLLFGLLVVACSAEPEISEVEVTRLVEVPFEVTRLIEVPIEVTRMIEVTVPDVGEPTAIPVPTSESCNVKAEEFINDIKAIAERWDDALALANSTPRDSLSPIIADLQEIKRDTNALESEECVKVLQNSLIQHMESIIDLFVLSLDPAYSEYSFETKTLLLVADQAMNSFVTNGERISYGGSPDGVDVIYITGAWRSNQGYTRNVSYTDAAGQTVELVRERQPWVESFTFPEGAELRLDVPPHHLFPDHSSTCVIFVNGKVVAQHIASGGVSCSGFAVIDE
jgi:hypothetical protein